MLNLKTLKKIYTVLLLVLSVFFISSTTYAKVQLPKINFVGIEHSPLVVGDSESFYVTSDYEGLVEYRVWINKVNTSVWEDITKGYTKAVDAKTPYVISPDKKFEKGKYKLSVWVKKAETEGENKAGYDTNYIANLNCVDKDDNNRVYVNNDMDIEKNEYTLGEKVIINGIVGIDGIKGPYKYKLHYFSPSKASSKNSGWVTNVTEYDNKIEWTPTEPGTYVLDVHVNTETSTTWNTYLKKVKENKLGDLSGTYEAWKLKIITVKEKIQDSNEINLNEVNGVYGSLDANNPEIMNNQINFSAENVTLRNITQTGNIDMLKNSGVLENAVVNGNVYITGNSIKLNNVKVKGNITINPGNTGIVYLDNVVANQIEILSGATESIHLNNVTTTMVIINSNNTVRVETTGISVIDKVVIKSNAILENDNSAIKEVELNPKENSEISLKGNYELINITKAVKLNITEGRINKMNTIVPFTLKVEATAYITELDKNKFEVTVIGKDTNIDIVKNNVEVVIPGGNNDGNNGGTVIPPVQDKPLNSISVALSNGQVFYANGSQSVLTADISGVSGLVKLIGIDIEVTKDCSIYIDDTRGLIGKTFNLSGGVKRRITPNELVSVIDKEKDGVSISNIQDVLAGADGYFTTTQTITYGNQTMQVMLKIKVK